MNKILIVGHPQSGYREVERLLRSCGMGPAQPSRREGLLPDQISDLLRKAHGCLPLNSLGNGREVRQIGAAPIWHGLALDLMLGNIEQPLWGWSDPDAVHLLDYWRELDPDLHFILVYDRPEAVITRMRLREAAKLSTERLQQRLDNWTAYNAALLDFHRLHPRRSLLVHAERVRLGAEDYLHHVRQRIDAPWRERLVGPGALNELALHQDACNVVDASPTNANGPSDDMLPQDLATLSGFLALSLLQDQCRNADLYEELQRSANLPMEEDPSAPGTAYRSLDAWRCMVTQQQQLNLQRQQARQLRSSRDSIQRLARQEGQRMARELDQVQQDRDRHLHLVHEREKSIATLQARERQILQRMGQLQERLKSTTDKADRETQSLGEQLKLAESTARQQTQALIAKVKATQEQAARDARDWQSRLEEAQARASSAPPTPAPTVPLSIDDERLLEQLHAVQQALERLYQENQRLKASLASAAPAARPVRLVGAGDRVREQLPYRIGACMIRQSRSVMGWLLMPLAIRAEMQRPAPVQDAAETPPLEAYSDVHDVARIRQHLSYRLGATFLACVRSPLGWLRMPFALRREVMAFRHQARA